MTDSNAPIIIAPFANERLREWPLANFHRFIELGLADGYSFAISGTWAQRALANTLVRPFPAHRVQNLCGTTDWREMQALLGRAPFVVANNSGIAHLAADLGQWLLCLFAGSHSWMEWMPRGPKVVTVARMPACSPCHSERCSNQRDCMVNLTGDLAYNEIISTIADYNAARGAPVQIRSTEISG
ncbi:glycosyltransferase family 9 protein [Silvimonas sp.]|uniref:glycosyltransferase family 9 protein n=1 Tax=Silvimonas sp. TaxID=2650811 RepID=UPI00284DD8FE|nr:glycosyltransferase family 9 protein [Silvimonas sp.]MDR3429575.1 glycosyltransferase family 9 protein [Silvimonas sp.]